MVSPVIADKAQMYGLYKSGEFGGGTRHWYGLEAIRASFPTCDVVMRYETPGATFPRCGDRVRPEEIRYLLTLWETQGADPEKIILGACFESDDIFPVLQGEVWRSPAGLYLRYTKAEKVMRQALRVDERHAEGLSALFILKSDLDTASWEWVNHLLDKYDGAVLEFSCYNRTVTEDGRNTIIWEVRHY